MPTIQLDIIIKYQAMSDNNLFERLFHYDSNRMDQELFEEEPQLRMLFESSPTLQDIEPLFSDKAEGEQEQESEPYSGQTTGEHQVSEDTLKKQPEQMTIKTKHISKTRKTFVENPQDQVESHTNKASRSRRRKGDKMKGYPTKNFLPNFKSPHIQYLQEQLGQVYVNSFELIRTIKSKNGINMKDYESLYTVPEFASAWEKFFAKRVLYRFLMISRSSMVAKKVHMRKLHVFQDAFRSKEFTRIN